MDEDAEEPQHFYAVGARDKVSDDLGAAASSTCNLVELLNLYSSAGFCLDPVQSDRLAIELLQAVSAASNLGIIQHALLAGSNSQISAMADIVDSLRSQAPTRAPAPRRPPHDTQAPPRPVPRAANALSDPAGVRRPGRLPDVRPLNICKRQRPPSTNPNPNFAMVASAAAGLPQPSQAKKARGAAAAQAGLVQMAKAFPVAPTQAIINAQHVVSGVAATAPSGAERARACIRQSTTHGPSCKEVVVITVPPVHWPDKPVIQVVNSFFGQHKLANRIVSEARRHLGGLTLVLASVPLQADTDALHLFFDRKAKEAAGENAVTRVEVGASRSYMHILNFPCYGAGEPQPDPVNGGYLPITLQAVKDLILSTPWKSGINFFQDSLPRIERSSSHSDTCMVCFDIYDSRGGLRLHALKGRSFMYSAHKLTFRVALPRVGVPICTKCWRFGHRFAVCPFRAQLCTHCAGPHHTDHHCVLGACCKAQPKANPPRAATPGGNLCPHPLRCVNCGLDHMSNDTKCSFWKHRFDAKWVQKKYTVMKVGDELLQFMPLPNTSFPNVVGARLPRRLPGTRSF
jgi:hypothetical protein